MGEWDEVADVEVKAGLRGDSAPAIRLWGYFWYSIVQFKHSGVFTFKLRFSMLIADILRQVRKMKR